MPVCGLEFWCQIIQRDIEYIIRYDGGGIAIHFIDENISKPQVDKALINQDEVEQIIKEILRNRNQS